MIRYGYGFGYDSIPVLFCFQITYVQNCILRIIQFIDLIKVDIIERDLN